MSNIITKQFEFENHSLTVQVDENGLDWFMGKQVAAALGYADTDQAVRDHVDEDDLSKRRVIDNMGRNQVANFVNESGLYSLILRSQKAEAKRFKRWVTAEVLPSIRQKGGYIASNATLKQLELLKADITSKEARIVALAEENQRIAESLDHVRGKCERLGAAANLLREANNYVPKDFTLDIDEDTRYAAELGRTSERFQVYVHRLKMKNRTLENDVKRITRDLHVQLFKATKYEEVMSTAAWLCDMFANNREVRRHRTRLDTIRLEADELERSHL